MLRHGSEKDAKRLALSVRRHCEFVDRERSRCKPADKDVSQSFIMLSHVGIRALGGRSDISPKTSVVLNLLCAG